MSLNRQDYERRILAYKVAFRQVAKKLGDKHPVTVIMGPLAWGRNDAERGPGGQTLRGAAVEFGFLHGYERALVRWCNMRREFKARDLLLDAVHEAMTRG